MPSPEPTSRRSYPSDPRSPGRRHHRSRHENADSHSHRHRHRDRSRSRSPHRSDKHRSEHRHRHDKDRGHDRDRERHDRRVKKPSAPVVLPYQARELGRRDLEIYEPMFAMYLDIQKGKFIEDLDEDEVKGRWKSFTGKWNRGELAEGWYDPATLKRAQENAAEYAQQDPDRERASPDYNRDQSAEKGKEAGSEIPTAEDDGDDDDYGPALPQPGSMRAMAHPGPTIPNMQDLDLKRETAIEDAIAARQESRDQHRSEVRFHKAELRHLQDEVAPRAEPGTRERQLEKKREAAAANHAFAQARGGSPEAAPEEELMGAGDNDLASLKKEKERNQRKKNEREIRREEILRARAAEREERIQQYRAKEDETIGWLRTLAKERFG
ncbi:hypothetical protein N7532_004559 [Penicillium argentinense]|uniref:Uncharacterized protein n=1 Tax=Penicillium argentinense TaxID=1131581 RepID=A0A9W9FQ60_9EURO|nr:uncharacterized protein N7532_004559 [Penicillium argentinense]KAJ5104030.1 hypothetical protein N7532_004559 [Penicillium argentinense]